MDHSASSSASSSDPTRPSTAASSPGARAGTRAYSLDSVAFARGPPPVHTMQQQQQQQQHAPPLPPPQPGLPMEQPPPAFGHPSYPPLHEQQQQQQHHPHPHYGSHQNGGVPNGLPFAGRPGQQQQQQQQQHHVYPPALQSPSYPPTNYYGALPPSQAGYAPAAARRKHVRAAQACNQCRQRKQKCDELKPCTFCREAGLGDQCHYRDVPPPKHDRNMADVVDKLGQMSGLISALTEKVATMDQTLATLKAQPAPARPAGSATDREDAAAKMPPPDAGYVRLRDVLPELYDRQKWRPFGGGLSIPRNHKTGAHKLLTHWSRSLNRYLRVPGKQQNLIVAGENYAMESEHRRGLIRLYGRGEGQDDSDGAATADYTTTNLFLGPTASHAGLAHHHHHHPTQYHHHHHHHHHAQLGRSSPTGAGQLDRSWGSPKAAGTDFRTPDGSSIGGINADGSLKLNEVTVTRLFQSFMANIHRLHPFIDRKAAEKLIKQFIAAYSPDALPPPLPSSTSSTSSSSSSRSSLSLLPTPVITDFGEPLGGGGGNNLKRKRSVGLAYANNPSTATSHQFDVYSSPPPPVCANAQSQPPRQPIERTINNAIVLLILALGKICDWKQPVPGPVPRPDYYSSPAFEQLAPVSASWAESPRSAYKPSPASSHSTMTSMASPTMEETRQSGPRKLSSSGEPSFSPYERRDGVPVQARNVDRIPGLAYFAKATEMLGNYHCGLSLPHVHANLLAGLYMGQLARVLESWCWINSASRACYYLIESGKVEPLPDGNKLDARIDLLKFSFWTCLQLESDILAELNLPASGISMCEDEIGMPLGLMMDPLKDPAMLSRDVKDMAYYLAQVEIRRILNRAHTVLYAEPNQKDHNSPWEKFDPRDLDWSLTRWRETLPHFLRWDDSDAPATDINAARLRAKYYGARYVINRPFLHYAVHTMAPQPIEFLAENDVPPPPHGDANGTAMETKRDNVFYSEHKIVHSKRLLRAAKASVEAAFRSTVAIDNVDGRPIVTNIWGTAHAQFGNMLVLTAVRGSWLYPLVPKDKLMSLLTRTINFLQPLSQLSPTLAKDHDILNNIRMNLHIENSQPYSTSSSFST